MWYRYYAGFSSDFVGDVLDDLNVGAGARLLDPWMGSGTTLAVGAGRDALVAGLDLNPAMAVIAKGRLVAVDTEASVQPLAAQISGHWKAAKSLEDDDYLTCWFDADSSALIRGMISRIDDLLVSPDLHAGSKATNMSSIAAFYYVAMFRTVTLMLRGYSSRNPTWVKKNKPGAGTIQLTPDQLTEKFLQSVSHLAAFIKYRKQIPVSARDGCKVSVGDSRKQPFEDETFDAVLTSPPYLTRLDYVVGHLPELAVLGLSAKSVDALRSSMIGTPTITDRRSSVQLSAPVACLVEEVAQHDSYAARSYYAKNMRQYFEGMADSLSELDRVMKSGAYAAFVVQDSHFKNLHLDLAAAIANQALDMGWTQVARRDFVNVRSMASLNTRAHDKARTTKPIETVLLLKSG